MRNFLLVLLIISCSVFAGGSFSTGGSELFGFSGYSKFRYGMWGQEGHDPSGGFDFYNRTDWSPRISDLFSAKLSFDTKFGFTRWDSLTSIYVSDDYTLKLVEAYGQVDLASGINIRGGRFKLPFGHFFNVPEQGIPFYGRTMCASDPVFGVYGGIDLGLMLTTDFGPAVLSVSYTNGTDSHADTTMKKQFTAFLSSAPAPWITISGAAAVAGQPQMGTNDSWSSTGLDLAAYGNYVLSRKLHLDYSAEFTLLPWLGPEADNMTNEDGGDYYVSLAVTNKMNTGYLTAIQPAVRYEVLSPPEQVNVGATVPESDVSALDFCLNFHTGEMSTVQFGGRSYTYQNGDDGYTDVYLNWRLLF